LVVQFSGQNGKPIKTLFLGKQHLKKSGQASPFGEEDLGWPDGRYVKADDSDTVAVISEPLENTEPTPEAWLNKDFIRIQKAKSIEVDFPKATNSWKLVRDTESSDWKLADAKPGEQLDPSKTASVSYPLDAPTFADVLPGTNLEETVTNRPTVVKIDAFDGFNYTVRVGPKTRDDYPVTVAVAAEIPKERVPGKDEKPADKAKLDQEFKDQRQKLEEKLKQEQSYAPWTYLVSSWAIDPLLKERPQLLVEKKEQAKKNGIPPANAAASSEESNEAEPGADTNSVPAPEP
jgi:hypothetical protein